MEMIKIRVDDFYNKPEYYRFMPKEIFNAMEVAELKGALIGEEILAEVPKDLFEKMIKDINESKTK